MSNGDDLMITLETDAGRAIEDIKGLQDEVKDLNAELEYTLDLLDDLKNHEASSSLRADTDDRLRVLEKRFLHGEYDDADDVREDARDGGAAPPPPVDFDE